MLLRDDNDEVVDPEAIDVEDVTSGIELEEPLKSLGTYKVAIKVFAA